MRDACRGGRRFGRGKGTGRCRVGGRQRWRQNGNERLKEGLIAVWQEALGAKLRGMEVEGRVGIENDISQAVGGRKSLLVEKAGVLLGSRETEG